MADYRTLNIDGLEWGIRDSSGGTAIPTSDFEYLAITIDTSAAAEPADGDTDGLTWHLTSATENEDVVIASVYALSADNSRVGFKRTGHTWIRTDDASPEDNMRDKVVSSTTIGACQAHATLGSHRIEGYRSRTLADGTTSVNEYWLKWD